MEQLEEAQNVEEEEGKKPKGEEKQPITKLC